MNKSPMADLSKEYLTTFLGTHLLTALHQPRKGFLSHLAILRTLKFTFLHSCCMFHFLFLWVVYEGVGAAGFCFVWPFPCLGHCSNYKMKSRFSSAPHRIKRQLQTRLWSPECIQDVVSYFSLSSVLCLQNPQLFQAFSSMICITSNAYFPFIVTISGHTAASFSSSSTAKQHFMLKYRQLLMFSLSLYLHSTYLP